ncbi:MAG: prephenate dehydrogenase [Anaerolineae bacterium]|nr:prephenate dehydrogenase [Anaerolineae bacterium]MDK1117152.1 prephenate dehydrogenase [Anaerolineae bacterium]
MSDESGFVLKESTIAIIGLGLMGGSIALSLKERCRRIKALDPDQETLKLAKRQAIVHEADSDPTKILRDVDLVILACPVPDIVDWTQRLPEFIQSPCIVFDVGSSKRTIVTALETLPGNFDPIGGHPICGRENLSLKSAERFLYRDAPFVFSALSRTSERARSAALQIVTALGANLIWLDADDHDRILAFTSHMPYLLASALALATTEDAAPIIGPGFRSSARLAGTSSSMMLGVLLSNRDNILASFAQIREALTNIESILKSSDRSALKNILDESYGNYQSLIAST